jgi:hypothetical protein
MGAFARIRVYIHFILSGGSGVSLWVSRSPAVSGRPRRRCEYSSLNFARRIRVPRLDASGCQNFGGFSAAGRSGTLHKQLVARMQGDVRLRDRGGGAGSKKRPRCLDYLNLRVVITKLPAHDTHKLHHRHVVVSFG